MLVLVINAGSSSLKHALVDTDRQGIVRSGVERWDSLGAVGLHARALRAAVADGGGRAAAVGHRVVHGGYAFAGPVVLDAGTRSAIAALEPLAPLHTRAALEGIDAAAAALPGVPQVACFDTAFHRTLGPAARACAVPGDWTERFGLRRYGFHGLNVAWCAREAARLLGAAGARRLVVCHLGSGCSVTAVLAGRSVDTTMGFTPLDGVPMATRPGSLDPGLLLFLLAGGVGVEELSAGLNHRSGLAGLSGLVGVREVEAAASAGDARAQLAFDVLVRGVSGAVAAMTTALGGLDAIVFTAGAGERSARLRGAVCDRLAHLGVSVEAERNGRDAPRIEVDGGEVAVLVVRAGEEIVVARETAALLAGTRAQDRC